MSVSSFSVFSVFECVRKAKVEIIPRGLYHIKVNSDNNLCYCKFSWVFTYYCLDSGTEAIYSLPETHFLDSYHRLDLSACLDKCGWFEKSSTGFGFFSRRSYIPRYGKIFAHVEVFRLSNRKFTDVSIGSSQLQNWR